MGLDTHDADGCAEGFGGEVDAELCADGARRAMGTGDLAPDDADLAGALVVALARLGDLGVVHESDALAVVELGVLG